MDVTRAEKCRSCGGGLGDLWDLGEQHVVGFYNPDAIPAEPAVPLVLAMCEAPECGLVQLRHSVSRDRLFSHDYWYRSGINESMVSALADVTSKAMQILSHPLLPEDTVIDIGANDGTLLKTYPSCCKVAYEPSESFREELGKVADICVSEFFPSLHYAPAGGTVKIITAIAMLYDLEDPQAFVAEVKRLLHPEGVFVAQFSGISTLVNQGAFDSICHEHLEYYSMKSLLYLFGCHDLIVQRVEFNGVNGGSLRVYVRHAGAAQPEPTVQFYLQQEGNTYFPETYEELSAAVARAKWRVKEHLHTHQTLGGIVTAYGASTKGLTLFQYFGLDSEVIQAIAERNPEKHGLLYGHTGIPIVSEEEWRKVASLAVIGPWHFREGILQREGQWLADGGKFLFPLPEVQVIG